MLLGHKDRASQSASDAERVAQNYQALTSIRSKRQMATSGAVSIVTPAQVFVSGLERTNTLSKGFMAIITPLLLVMFGVAFALSGQWAAPTMPSPIEAKAAIEIVNGWSCPTGLGGPLVDAGQICRFPAAAASSVKDMITAQMSCGSCG
jgi:hypothetical protein